MFTCTKSLRRHLEINFPEVICFFSYGKFVIVYSADTTPCQYAVSTLKGNGLRNRDLTSAFPKMIRSSVESGLKSQDEDWPMSTNELAERLNTKSIAALYNAIFLTVYSRCKYNDYGYAETKYKTITNKIWSIASDWTSLITGKRSSKQIMLGMTLHRVTASKEVATILNKSGHCI